jgi:hypothetical protein
MDSAQAGRRVPTFGIDVPAGAIDVPVRGTDVSARGTDVPMRGNDVPDTGQRVPSFGKPQITEHHPIRMNLARIGQNVMFERSSVEMESASSVSWST